jgi:hypothetical protein
MIGNTAEAWPYCRSRSDIDMLRVWFTCSPFMPSERGVNTVATPEVCTKDVVDTLQNFLLISSNYLCLT